MNSKISESIFSGETTIIPMADVQHIEKCKQGGIIIITCHTKWDVEQDYWANNIYLNDEESKKFLEAWCYYRYEKDIKPYED